MLQFSRRNDLQNTGIDPAIENRRIVWTFMFEAAGRKVSLRKQPSFAPGPSGVSRLFSQARRKAVAFHTITDFTLLHVLSRNYK